LPYANETVSIRLHDLQITSSHQCTIDARSSFEVGCRPKLCPCRDLSLDSLRYRRPYRRARRRGRGVLVSSTVKDLVAGSGLRFVDRGIKPLKGVPGEWHIFAVER
jgi:hypothetical protein